MGTIAKASDHVKPCNIEQSERHNRRDPDYIASLDPRKLYVRLELTHNNEIYVVPDLHGPSSQFLHHDFDIIIVLLESDTLQVWSDIYLVIMSQF